MFTLDPRLSTLQYQPGNFRPIAESENGRRLLSWLSREDTVVRMETACYLQRVAIEPLSPHLVDEFGAWVAETKSKQLVGHMVKAILRHLGYAQVAKNVTLYRGLFAQGARYQLSTHERAAPGRPSPEQRRRWTQSVVESKQGASIEGTAT